jgi:2-amino-4-hydroxy-6-hydroxymethyldihydropteridine diphosphokinase
VNKKNIVIPHEKLHKRRFVLIPLVELYPDLVHPVINKTVSDILYNLNDNKEVKFYGKV